MIQILHKDKRIIVCVKPAGIVSTDVSGGMPELIKRQLNELNGCVKTVHRLDQVVGGLMVFARSKEAARRISAQINNHIFVKKYLAVVEGTISPKSGLMNDYLKRDKAERRTYIVNEPDEDTKEATLAYQVLASRENLCLVMIKLYTGRTHQIRAQFSGRNTPIYGDKKYGSQNPIQNKIALWSCSIQFEHPQNEDKLSFYLSPPSETPWNIFKTELENLYQEENSKWPESLL